MSWAKISGSISMKFKGGCLGILNNNYNYDLVPYSLHSIPG